MAIYYLAHRHRDQEQSGGGCKEMGRGVEEDRFFLLINLPCY